MQYQDCSERARRSNHGKNLMRLRGNALNQARVKSGSRHKPKPRYKASLNRRRLRGGSVLRLVVAS